MVGGLFLYGLSSPEAALELAETLVPHLAELVEVPAEEVVPELELGLELEP